MTSSNPPLRAVAAAALAILGATPAGCIGGAADSQTTPGSGLPDPSHSHITCTRTGTGVLCGDGAGRGLRTVPTGALTETTFRACNSLVTDSASEVCDTRTLELTFP